MSTPRRIICLTALALAAACAPSTSAPVSSDSGEANDSADVRMYDGADAQASGADAEPLDSTQRDGALADAEPEDSALPDAASGDAGVTSDSGVGSAGNCSPASLLDPRVLGASAPSITSLTGDATIELWMRRDGAGAGASSIYEQWLDSRFTPQPINLRIQTIKADGQGYRAGEIDVWVAGAELRSTFSPGVWTHVAVVRRAGGCALFLGGVQRASVACTTGPIYIDQLSVGFVSRAPGDYEVHGAVTGLRISSSARYIGRFSPPVHYTPDADTALLWNFDEGSGALVRDASSSRGDGRIAGGSWSTDGPCSACGDGLVQSGETCDDGHLTTRDCAYGALSCMVCTETCSLVPGATAYCGDGRLNAAFGEACDDGNASTEVCTYGQRSCTVCASSCQLVPGATAYCGDGVINATGGETCDDGNTTTESCAYGQTSCSVCGSRCRIVAGPTQYCGDGVVNASNGESCDDGNTVTETCAYGQQSCTVCAATCRSAPGATAYCGDGVVDSSNGETCDDGNTATESCAYGQMSCSVCGSSCRTVAGPTRYCGDGVVNASNGESCDDGNTVTETCAYGQQSCTVCAASCRSIPGATAYCGDGVVDSSNGETCDDGNNTPGDGCSTTCTDESCHPAVTFDGSTGWASVPSVPATTSFTIEGWVKGRPPPSQARVFGTLCGSLSWDVNGFWAEVFPDCNGTSRRYANDFVAQVIPYTSFPSDWFHLAMVVPAPNQVRIYVNGQLVASSNSLPYDNGVGGRYCGSIAATQDCGHGVVLRYSALSVSDFRVSTGARYSGNFTPAQPLTSDASTVVRYDFLEGGGTRLTDRSGGGRDGSLMGGATWGCASQESYAIKATALTSSLTCNNSGFGIGHGNFTFEFWIKAHDEFASSPIWGTSPAGQLFTQNENYAANAIRPGMASGGQMRSYTYNTFAGPANIDHITGFVDDGRWHHYALVREGSTARTYIDGALSATQSGIDPNVVAMSNMAIGTPQAYSSYTVPPVLLGPIRYSSTVRYSSAFVPAKTWTVDGNTIAQYLTMTPFDGTTLQDEAGRDNDCTYRSGWIPSQGP